MNETTNPNSIPNVVRPNGDQRLRSPEIPDPPGTGNAPGARIVAGAPSTPVASSATPAGTSTDASAAPRTPAPTGTPSAPSEAAPALLDKVVQGAHDTVDRLADSAAPTVRRLGERVSATEDALHAGTDHLRQIRDEWTAGMRTTVRGNPLACVAGALAVGALIARITR